MFFKKLFRVLPVVISGILIVTAGVFAWTEPSASPPGGNIAAPINVSGTAQTKTGNLTLPNLYLNASGNEGNIYKANIIAGYNDIFIKGDESETSNVYIAGSNLNFYTSNSQRMTITSDGKVGIGTTSPQYALDVAGVVRVGNLPAPPATAYNGAIYYDTRPAYNKFRCYQAGEWWDCLGTAAGGTNYWTASSNNIYNNNSGNVGIGTTSPSQKLHVKDGSIFIEGSSDGQGRVVMKLSDGNQFEWWPKSTGLHLYDRTALAYRFSVLNNGNVGIGTTAPVAKLHIKGGNLKVESSNGDRSIELGVTGDAVDLWAVGKSLNINNNPVNNGTFINPATGNVEILGDNTTRGQVSGRMVTIRGNLTVTSGNVGIRTVSNLGGDVLTVGPESGSTSEGGQIGFMGAGTNRYFKIDNYYGTLRVITQDASGESVKFVIGNDGNVGIGTASPRSTFEVSTGLGLYVTHAPGLFGPESANGMARIYNNQYGTQFENFTNDRPDLAQATLRLLNDGHAELNLGQNGAPNDWFSVLGRITSANKRESYTLYFDRDICISSTVTYKALRTLNSNCSYSTINSNYISCASACNQFCKTVGGVGYSGGTIVEANPNLVLPAGNGCPAQSGTAGECICIP